MGAVLRRRRAVLIAALASLAVPAAAQADSLSRDGTVVVLDSGPSDTANNNVLLFSSGNEHLIMDTVVPITDENNDSGCTDVGAGQFSCMDITGFRIVTRGGNDTVDGQGGVDNVVTIPLAVDLGTGSDWVFGGSAGDTLDGGFGQDTINGNGGLDTASYANRTERVMVQLGAPDQQDGSANDGTAGARDYIAADVEGATGGSGDDSLTGGTAPTILRGGPGGDGLVGTPGVDTLEGGDGADSLNPLGGADTVLAGAGVDLVESRDGQVDTVDCGADPDHALADSGDVLTSCEPPPPPGPPAPTVITETITLPSRVLFDLAYTFSAARRTTTLKNIEVAAEPGARLSAGCRTRRGRRCPRTRDLARATASTAVRMRGFENKRLPVGARLEIRVTKDGMIGSVKTVTIRARRAPSVRTLCLPPGATRPAAC